jgi:hypothetical protein
MCGLSVVQHIKLYFFGGGLLGMAGVALVPRLVDSDRTPPYIEKIEHFGFVLPIVQSKIVRSIFAISRAVGVSHRRLEWQTFAGIALAVHSGPSPVIV